MGVPIANNIDLKGGQTSTIALWTLQRPYKSSGLDPDFLYYLSLRLPADFKFLWWYFCII